MGLGKLLAWDQLLFCGDTRWWMRWRVLSGLTEHSCITALLHSTLVLDVLNRLPSVHLNASIQNTCLSSSSSSSSSCSPGSHCVARPWDYQATWTHSQDQCPGLCSSRAPVCHAGELCRPATHCHVQNVFMLSCSLYMYTSYAYVHVHVHEERLGNIFREPWKSGSHPGFKCTVGVNKKFPRSARTTGACSKTNSDW